MKVEFGKININSSRFEGEVVFTTHEFSEPPKVSCQLVRSNPYVYNVDLRYSPIYLINFTKDGFKCKTNGNFQPGDQIHWIAVGN